MDAVKPTPLLVLAVAVADDAMRAGFAAFTRVNAAKPVVSELDHQCGAPYVQRLQNAAAVKPELR